MKARYDALKKDREPYLTRARKVCSVTIPSLLPLEGSNGSSSNVAPWQSEGAQSLMNLAAKLLLALLPPTGQPVFQYDVPPGIKETYEGDLDELDATLGKAERTIQSAIDAGIIRAPLYRVLLQLLAIGDTAVALEHADITGLHFKYWRLDEYVQVRDPFGEPIEIILMEPLAPVDIPPEFKEKYPEDETDPNKMPALYTVYRLTERTRTKGGFTGVRWESDQYINDDPITDTHGTYTECPIWTIPWALQKGEHYGRSFVEEVAYGDLKTLNQWYANLVQLVSINSLTRFLENPGGITRMTDIMAAPNGGHAPGREEDIHVLQVDKRADMEAVLRMAQHVETRIDASFLKMASIQRTGERVTATEIQTLARELEDALGGAFSALAKSIQLPLVERSRRILEGLKDVPKIPDNIRLQVTTGLAAIGRAQDREALVGFLTDLSVLGPAKAAEVIAKWVNEGTLLTRLGTSRNLDLTGLIKTIEEVQEETEQERQMTLAQGHIGREAAKGVMNG